MNARIPWLDNIKGICMLCVILAHCTAYYGLGGNSLLIGYFHPFYVAAFFFASGYLYIDKLFSANITELGLLIKNVIFRIIIPTIIFSIILYFPKILYRSCSLSILDFLYDTLGGCSFWFTSAMAISQILLIVLIVVCRIHNIFILGLMTFLLAVVGYLLVQIQNNPFPWFYKSGMAASFYMALGYFYRNYEEKLNKRWIKIFVILGYFTLITIFWQRDLIHLGMILLNFTPLGVVTSFLGILLVTYVSKRITNIYFLTFVGKNSISYYFLCGLMPAMFSTIVMRLYPIKSYSSLVAIFIITTIISTACVFIVNRYFYWLLDLRKIRGK